MYTYYGDDDKDYFYAEYFVQVNGEPLSEQQCKELEDKLFEDKEIQALEYDGYNNYDIEFGEVGISDSSINFNFVRDLDTYSYDGDTEEEAAVNVLEGRYIAYIDLFENILSEVVKKYMPDAEVTISNEFKNKDEYIKSNLSNVMSDCDEEDYDDDDYDDDEYDEDD